MNTTTFGGVKITWFGHSSFMFEFRDVAVYVDPYVLPPHPKQADIVLHSHPHFDHCARSEKIMKPSTVLIGHGCTHAVRPIEIGDKVAAFGIIIEAVHAYNTQAKFHPRGFGAGFIITFGQTPGSPRIYFAGDTDHIPEMSSIKCDVALLPIGGTYTMDATSAARAATQIRPKIAIPMHYNYLNDLKCDPAEFRRLCTEFGAGCDVRILA